MAKIGFKASVRLQGSETLLRKLRLLKDMAVPVVASSLYLSASDIMYVSKSVYCPVDTGTLRNSGRVNLPVIQDTKVEVSLGYGGPAAPYALAVHENPRAGKTYGYSPRGQPYQHWARSGQWKYLETPVKAAVNDITNNLGTAVDRKLLEISNGGG